MRALKTGLLLLLLSVAATDAHASERSHQRAGDPRTYDSRDGRDSAARDRGSRHTRAAADRHRSHGHGHRHTGGHALLRARWVSGQWHVWVWAPGHWVHVSFVASS